jgi:transposase
MFIYDTVKKEQYYQEVVEMYKNTGYSSYRLSKHFPLSKHTLQRWIANFVAENPQEAIMKRVKTVRNAPAPSPDVPAEELPKDVQELQAELKELRAQLTKAEIKAEAYDELINVAEAKFNIQIRKKAGAKQ